MRSTISLLTPHTYIHKHIQQIHTLTRSVFLAPLLLLMMILSGPPMEQMFFSRAPPQTGTVDTAKSWTDGGWKGLINTLSLQTRLDPLSSFHITMLSPFSQRTFSPSRKSSSVTNNINDGSVLFKCSTTSSTQSSQPSDSGVYCGGSDSHAVTTS